MDDLDRQFPYPRYLKVPFIFWADGTPEPPEWAQFKRDYPGWVVFRGWFVPDEPAALEPEPEQHNVSSTAHMTEAEAEADYWAHHDAQSGHRGETEPAPWPNSDTVSSVLPNPMGNSNARFGGGPARINGKELWTSEGLSAAIHASAAHIAAYHGDVDAALAAAKAGGLNGTDTKQAKSAADDAVSIPISYAVSLPLQISEPIAQTASPDAHDVGVSRGLVQLAANDGTPGNNQAQNAQMDAIVRILRLNKDQRRELHEAITGQNYGFQQVLSIAKDMFGE
jgi:hypothetical protein